MSSGRKHIIERTKSLRSEVKIFVASPDEVSDFTHTSVSLEDAFDTIDTEARLNPDTVVGTLILPADILKEDALDILDELRKSIKENL